MKREEGQGRRSKGEEELGEMPGSRGSRTGLRKALGEGPVAGTWLPPRGAGWASSYCLVWGGGLRPGAGHLTTSFSRVSTLGSSLGWC